LIPTADTPTKTCPACHAEFRRNHMGRPKRFCTDECRRVFTQLRAELPMLEAELDDARVKAASWSTKAYWLARVHTLEVAIAEARARVAEDR
jgi:hypothetical protein